MRLYTIAQHTIATLFFVLFLLSLSASTVSAQKLQWRDSYAKALEDAKEQGKIVFVFVTGSEWSEPCRRYRRTVIDSPDLARLFGEKFVAFELDRPDWPTEEQKKAIGQELFILGD